MTTSPPSRGQPPEWADANCRAVLEAAPDAMVVVNRAGEIVAANLQATKLYGYSREHLIGRVVESLIPARLRDRHRQHRENFFANPEKQAMQVIEIFAVRSDASEIPVDVSLSLLTIGTETFSITAVRDATERRRLQELKRGEAVLREKNESEERFRLAAQAGKMYAYEWDIATDLVVRSEEHVNVLGFSEPRQLTRQELLARVHPEDRPLFVGSVDHLTPQHPTLQIGYRVLCPDGSVVWLEKNARGFFDEQGKLLRVIGMVANITERKQAEEALRASEERLRLAQQIARIGSFDWNLQTGVNTWTPEVEAMYGLQPGGFSQTQTAFENLVHADDRAGVIKLVDHALKTGQPTEGEWRVVWPDGSVHWIAGRWQVLMNKSREAVRMIGVNLDVTERKRAEEALLEVNRRLIEAQEKERARIGRELHDDISQQLAMLALELEQLEDNPSEVRSRVQDLRKQTTEISNDVQALSHELHSSKVEYLGAVGGMKSWCKEFGERQGIQIEFKSTQVETSVAPEIGLCLFRVLQEALHNAAKHSGVKRIEVQLREDSGEIHLVISDLGRGFDLETAMQGRGLGLTSMHERVRLVNGITEIQAKPMGGTTVHVRVPLRPEHASQRAAG